MLSPAFADKYIEIEKPINLRITTLDHMFQNVETFASMFGDEIEIKEIRGTGNTKSADIFVDGPMWCNVDTSMRATKQNDSYIIDFEGNDLDQSKMKIQIESTWGWNDKTGDPKGATVVFLEFDGKDIPCESMASDSLFKDIFNDGLYRLEQNGLPIEKQLEQERMQEDIQVKSTSSNQNSQETTETKPKQVELKGPPRIDSDNDGISDDKDLCQFDKEVFNGYLDSDGCPDEKPKQESKEKQIPTNIKETPQDQPKVVKNDRDGDGIPDNKDLCQMQAEVYNGYIDWDGCPDTETGQIKIVLDDDKDGILNHLDQCPTMKEVHNGFQDNDGCPDAVMQNQPYQENESPIPDWVKSNAKWYSVGSITERDFAQSLQYMIKDDIIHIEKTGKGSNSEFSVGQIPNWVQTSAGWWADGKMSDKEFVKTIQHLVDEEIIKVH